MRTRRMTPHFAATLGTLAALSLAGCGGGTNSVGPGGNTVSLVRAVNALQGCPANVDIEQANVMPVPFQNLASGAVPAGYTSLRAGNGLAYGVFATGTTKPAIASTNVDLVARDPSGDPNSGHQTLVATGSCSGGAGVAAPQLLNLQDSFPFTFGGVNAGTVGLRVVNLIPDFNGGITLASNGAPLHGTDDAGTNAVPYASLGGFNGKHYNAGINLTGNPVLTIRTNANAILATVPNFNFQPNHAYTLFVIGRSNPPAGGQPVTVVPVLDY